MNKQRPHKNKIKIHKRWDVGRIILILIIIIINSNAHAFTFDVWESGMDADTVIMTAMKNDIPLRKSGYAATGGKGFEKQYTVPYKKKATEYGYQTDLLGEGANVKLFMTEKEKLLMQIQISWTQGKEIKEILKKIILNKNPISKRKKHNPLGKTTTYRIDNENEIEFKYSAGILIVTYGDTALMGHDEKTKKNNKQTTTKDAGKF